MYVEPDGSVGGTVDKRILQQKLQMGNSANSPSRMCLVNKAERAFPKNFADAVRVCAAGGGNSSDASLDDVSEQADYVDAIISMP